MTTKITSDNISSLSNMGVTWNAVTVADGSTQLSASAGNGYFLDTNTGVIEVFLPSSPSRGDTVVLADYSGTFGLNNVIVNSGGKNIDSTEGGPGSSNDFLLDTNNQVVELVYVDTAKGWLVRTNSSPGGLSAIGGGGSYGATFIAATGGTVTTTGNFKVHTFTGDGCFVVSSLGNDQGGGDTVDYLVVAGGGAGGFANGGGGGGGAGGLRYSDCTYSTPAPDPSSGTGLTVTATTFPITVGGGGTPRSGSPDYQTGGGGSNSVFSTITSAGGGGGGGGTCGSNGTGLNGGSGGGGGKGSSTQSGGSGNTPPVSPPQGNNGGNGGGPGPLNNVGGGGGGAGAAGCANAPSPLRGGDGGNGLVVSINGSCAAYSGGGGGQNEGQPAPAQGQGGSGGGGTAGETGADGNAGSANTGGGGGGADSQPNSGVQSGAGGKGVVIIRYKFQTG